MTLASIVEKETGIAAERPHVAAVFVNRLRRGMKLQSDPDGDLRPGTGHRRTRPCADHAPIWSSLRPTIPMSSTACRRRRSVIPGAPRIAAVLSPASSDDLYFVADGSGGHVFADTLEEHNRNVAALAQAAANK